MATEVIAGHEISVDDEGFMTDPSEWSEELAEALSKDGDDSPCVDPDRVDDQAALSVVPQEAGEEDGVHFRSAQADRLRVRGEHRCRCSKTRRTAKSASS